MTQEPRNHHFIPQHFLRSWYSDNEKVFRYRVIPGINKFEVKNVGIKKTASIKDLYKVDFPDGSLNMETEVVTPKIDNIGSRVLQKAIKTNSKKWTKEDNILLANYLVYLEARHPVNQEAMNIGNELDSMRAEMKKEKSGSEKSIDVIINYFQGISSLGPLMLGFLASFEKNPNVLNPFSRGMLSAQSMECAFNTDCLLSSDYPTSRWGDYEKTLLFIVSLSPRKAIIYSMSNDIGVFNLLSQQSLSQLINLYTLAKAETAYYMNETMEPFVRKHLGWARKLSLEKAQDYVRKFIISECS